ncbi:MAG TPA: translocation/assembly module TamB domain-containing protein, partial [Longimicrobium sp.]|nr:translocation/assembly module TamB domain-containing protein [Longimicrobium sp.]
IVPGFDPLEQGPLTALVRADSLPMALIAQALPQLEDDATGTIVALVQVSGTLDDPEVRGNARVVDGALTVTALGARWEDINGNLSLDGDLVRIDSLTARTGDDGRAYVDGTVRLDDPKRPLVYIRLNLDEFQVIDNPEVAELQAYSRVAISGRLPGAVVTGSVKIEDGNIYIPELGAATEQDIVDADVGQLGADTIDAPVTITQRLLSLFAPQDLEVEVGDRVWLKSNDANIQIGGRVGVSRGPGGGFLVTGDLEARRGTFDVGFGFFEREFDIVEGRVQFFGTADLNAALDITASHEVRAVDTDAPLTIFVHLGGTLQNPRLDFTTDQRTPIATSDIASLLLFGRRVEELGGLGGAFASEVLTQELFGNLLAAGIERGLISTGLVDYVRVRSSTAAAASGASGGAFGFDFLSAVTVELGKEVVDNVFVALQLIDFPSELKLGGALDWRVTRTLSVRAEYGPVRRDPLIRNSIDVKRQATVDVRWRYEYGRPKTDEPPPAPAATEEPKPGQPSTPTGQPPPEPPP